MGPDEYHGPVNDSVYCNVVAQISLQAAHDLAPLAGREANGTFADIASKLVILFNTTSQMHPEFAGYTGDTVKQADVILLGYPLAFDMPAHVRANDLIYYANRANPANGGNAEGNWWTPSSALDTDCDGNPVTATTKLSRDCIYQKKVAEIRDRQAISQENAGYKVERLEQISVRAERKAAEKAERAAADKARFDKYAQRR